MMQEQAILDVAKVKRNIQRMIDQGAPESEIDGYVASEGTSPEALRQYTGNMAELSSLSQRFDTNNGAPKIVDENADRKMRASLEATKIQQMQNNGAFSDFADSTMANLPLAKTIVAAPLGLARMFTDGVNPIEGYKRAKDLLDEQQYQREQRSPAASAGGMVAGNVMGAAPIVKGVQALGLGLKAGAGLLPRIGAGIVGGGTMGALAGFDQGTSLDERLANTGEAALTGAAFGGALPAVGATLRKVGGSVANKVQNVFNPDAAAARTVKKAMEFDRSIGSSMSADDLAAARANGQNLIVSDIGGRATGQLAKTATNLNPELRANMSQQLMDRAKTQSTRAIDKLSNIVGGKIDDIKMRDDLELAARKANGIAYKRAHDFNFGDAQPMALDDILKRMPKSAIEEAKVIAATEGRPFGEQLVASLNGRGKASIRRTPSMREWDYIQRGLRTAADEAFSAGKKGGSAAAFKDLHKELLNVLDDANPAFKAARKGAFEAFGAEDALDAGKVFARSRGDTGEMAKAVGKMNAPERRLFETGFASELIDRIKTPSDSVDVIKQVFGSPESRQKMVMAFGDRKASELEAFTRVEAAMQATKLAVTSGSQTAQYMFDAASIGGGSAASYVSGDPKYAMIGLALAGAKRTNAAINQRVVDKIGELLMSGDPKAIDRVIANASISKPYMEALRAITDQVAKIAPVAAGGIAGATTTQN
jgi:hypothetical protein